MVVVLSILSAVASVAIGASFYIRDATRKRLKQIIHSFRNPYVLLRPKRNVENRIVDFEIVEVNAAACARSRQSPDWWQGRMIRRLLPGRTSGTLFQRLCQVVETGAPWVLDHRFGSETEAYRSWFTDFRAVPACDLIGCTWCDVLDHEKTENALRRSEKRLRATLDTLLDPHVLLQAVRNAEGKIVDFIFVEANAQACMFNQLSHDQLIGRSLLDQHPAASRTSLLESYTHVVETGQPLILDDWEYPQDVLGGAIRRYDVRAVKFRDGISQTWRDVTERAECLARLIESEKYFRLLTENSVDVILRLQDDGEITWVSPSVSSSFGFSPQDWIGRNVTEIVEPESLSVWQGNLERIHKGQTLLARMQLRDHGATLHWVESQLKEFLLPEGDADGLVLGLRLIDDRVVAEQQVDEKIRQKLFESQEIVARAEQLSGVGSWQYMQDEDILLCSQQILDYIGLDRLPGDPFTGKQFLAALHPDDRPSIENQLRMAFADGRPFEFRARIPTGAHGERWILVRGALQGDSPGESRLSHGTVQDITELEILRSELDRSAWIDPVTGLPNRLATIQHLEKLLRESPDKILAVINIDIDNFQRLNDTFGGEHGNRFLCRCGECIRSLLGSSDWLGRIGGDEFLVLTSDVKDVAGAADLALRIQKGLVSSRQVYKGINARTSVSIGISILDYP